MRHHPTGLAPILLLGALGLGCGGNEKTEFPAGVDPLQEVDVAPAGDGDHPEKLTTETGEGDDYGFVEGRGYVKTSLSAVYEAIQDPEVCVDRRAVNRWSVKKDTEPEYDHSFIVHNEVDDVITVEFDITWRLAVEKGTEKAPVKVEANWQKTWGTTFIRLLRGSLVARKVDESTTEVELVEQLDAATGGIDPAVAFVKDFYASIVARAHGKKLPSY